MNFSEDQILALALDEPSRKTGKDLANPSKWVTKGAGETALWGECQGSGSKPYQTQIDLLNVAFKCSCPSRKFPCKHGLGLFLLYARRPDTFDASEMPPWVHDWISKRVQRDEKKEVRQEKQVDEAAQTRRQENREKKVAEGIAELSLWIKDIVRNGIIHLPEKSTAFWEQAARRMIDAQAPGLAALVKELAQINFFKDGWHSEFIDRLLNIYMLIHAYKNREALPSLLQHDVLSRIGFTQNQEELIKQTGITDTWLVLARHLSEDDHLVVEKYWLHGTSTGQSALILQFIVYGYGGQLSLAPGTYLQAELVFYPSVDPSRALIKKQVAANPVAPARTYSAWKEIAQFETATNALSPFHSVKAYIIKELTPVFYQQSWWLADENNDLCPISDRFTNIWKLLAISGGRPMTAAVIGNENQFEPVGVWINENYKIL